MSAPPLPEGASRLTTDEAIHAITVGDHPEGSAGSVVMDAALIEGLRKGELEAIRLADGRLAFTRKES